MIERLAESDKKKSLVLHRYYSEMAQTLSEMHRVLKFGRAAIVVVGTSVMRGVNVETHNCLSEIGIQAGFELVHIGKRAIDRNKRMMCLRGRIKPLRLRSKPVCTKNILSDF
ncbi:MAG: hypothetical protein HC887_02365 [Desulfobacteraceae bacterium]|nr:hypothetical protein [Desulfobacteraceae bacterium]